MTARRLHEFLDDAGVAYEVTEHEEAYAAHEVAQSEHVTGWDVAKPVMLVVGGDLAMCVVPAPVDVDLDRARDRFGGSEVRLAEESEFADAFPDSELGAHPPFGNLYDIPVFLDETMRARERMICRDGSHTETVTVATADFVRLVDPEIVDVGRPQG
jgi:Ala-tRNA(Pro) deacylase